MQELTIIEGQLLHRGNELENKQKHLCTLLNTTPIESNLPLSLVQINQKLQDQIKLLSELKVRIKFPSCFVCQCSLFQDQRLTQVSSYYLKLKEYSEQLEWTPSSPSSTVEYLLLEQFDRCLTADGLNEIETTIREVRQIFSFIIFLSPRLAGKPNRTTKETFLGIT